MKVFSLRLDDDLYALVQQAADSECRSMNEEITFALRRYLVALAAQGLIDLSPSKIGPPPG